MRSRTIRKLRNQATLASRGTIVSFCCLLLGAFGTTASAQEIPANLDESCIVTILNRNTQVNEDGSFGLANIPIPFGQFRARVVCEDENGVRRAQSAFVLGVPNGDTELGVISESTDAPIPTDLIMLNFPDITPENDTTQVFTFGRISDTELINVTPGSSGTFYLTSNPAIATVTQNGIVTGVTSGTALITATHEGVIGTLRIPIDLWGANYYSSHKSGKFQSLVISIDLVTMIQ